MIFLVRCTSHMRLNAAVELQPPCFTQREIYRTSTLECHFTMSANDIEDNSKPRECLITTGATAPFTDLIKAALDCLDTFKELGYTRVIFQAGDGLPYFHEIKPGDFKGVEIEAYAFSDGLYSQMRSLKSKTDSNGNLERKEGLVITHAGWSRLVN